VADLLKQNIVQEAHRLGFTLAGVTSPAAPQHLTSFEHWIANARHGTMEYLADDRARARRADPKLILPECRSILVLAAPYAPPPASPLNQSDAPRGRLAAYALSEDYHLVLPPRLHALVQYIEQQAGHPIPNRWYTDTGPILERDLAQRAGLGWIGKNTCLINPQHGSYFLLAEILLGLDLEPDAPFVTDHCGTCTRCIDACPTHCILPDRTIDARRCISYLTIELKTAIPEELRPLMGNWIFGCDICQQACPWNRFADAEGEVTLEPRGNIQFPDLIQELSLTPEVFNKKFKDSPMKRTKRRGYLRNVAVALGNSRDPRALPALQQALEEPEPLVREHAAWAIAQIES
jgi:epoxyqueuosine reductase